MAMIMGRSKNQEFVPLDLVIEILTRLPVKSVGKFLLVSKTWAKIIRSKAFVKAFPFRSLTQPWRVLIALPEYPTQPGEETCTWFFSYSSTASLSFLSKFSTPINFNDQDDYHSYFVNGLMSKAGTICNPSTGKSIIIPQIKTDTSTVIRRFFGYEPVNGEYKMLSVTVNMTGGDPCVKFGVFTLGIEQKAWRLIDCNIPHKPLDINGVCIDGAVYYVAYAGTQQSLMRFDLKSEKFDIFAGVSMDLDLYRYSTTLINYYGKVALHIRAYASYNESEVDLRVFKEAGKQDVLDRCVVELPEVSLFIKGTTHTGEMIFVNTSSTEANVICCDPKASSFKKLKIEGLPHRRSYYHTNYYLDYVESLMLL